MAAHVLVKLWCRIRREGIEALNDDELCQLKDGIIVLIKATGTTPPAFEANATILEMLSSYSSTTDQTKMSPGEPNPRDLGLLRDKVKYVRPEAKAEKVIEHKDETGPGDPTNSILNFPEGTATTEEYKSVVLAIDGLSFLLGRKEFCKVNPPAGKAEDVVPIGFELLWHRAAAGDLQQRAYDYAQQHQPRREMADQWHRLLRSGTGRRGWTKSSKTAAPLNDTNAPQKRAATEMREGLPRKKRITKYCCVPECLSNNRNSKLSRVPNLPPPLRENPTIGKQTTHHIKCFKRREWTDRLGFGRSCEEQDLRICEKHAMETVSGKSVRVSGNNSTVHITIEPFEAPVQIGNKSFHTPANTVSNGMGTDREILRHALKLSQEESNLSQPTQIALAREGIRNNENCPNMSDVSECDGDKQAWRQPRILFDSLTPDEVKRRTGFHDLKRLLSYSAVIYGGNLDEMAKTVTKMTFLEELVLAFEFTWGRSNIRMEELEKEYGCSNKVLKKAIIYRLRKELDCRKRWPMYASYEEDSRYRDPKWNHHFDPKTGPRVVMHDTTNIPLPDPSAGDLNRALHNMYYNMCCAKAGVGCQLCGWILGLPLVTGHSDDDRQIRDTMILELQKAFAENDPSSILHFLNIFDKGYHMLLETHKHGQLCCQPDKADDQFGGDKVLRTGCVAVVRSGNERAVKRSKMSWFLKRGCIDQLWDTDFLCDVWEAFTFRVNFMFDKFL